jgi:hypothetical protein
MFPQLYCWAKKKLIVIYFSNFFEQTFALILRRTVILQTRKHLLILFSDKPRRLSVQREGKNKYKRILRATKKNEKKNSSGVCERQKNPLVKKLVLVSVRLICLRWTLFCCAKIRRWRSFPNPIIFCYCRHTKSDESHSFFPPTHFSVRLLFAKNFSPKIRKQKFEKYY